MAETRIRFARTIEDDASPLEEAVSRGLDRPLVLWAHPEVGQSALIEAAAEAARLKLRCLEAAELAGWDGFRDVSQSGHFRPVSLETFLARGERADPQIFALEPDEMLHLEGLNLAPSRIVGLVFDGIVEDGRLMNNLLPEGARIVATALPYRREDSLALLGPVLREVWAGLKQRSELAYGAHAVPKRVAEGAEHWAVLPSARRFLAWGRRRGLAEEVLGFLEDLDRQDPALALASLHAVLLHPADPFPQNGSPRSFAELGALLAERRLYFSSRAVKRALAEARSSRELVDWLTRESKRWDPERWLHADAVLTWGGEPVPGAVWLRNFLAAIGRGEARFTLQDLPIYAAYESSSLRMWAVQELGDELGGAFVRATAIPESEFRRLERL